jgi:hypothetical protein
MKLKKLLPNSDKRMLKNKLIMLCYLLKSYGDYLLVEKPSTIDNLGFMVEYQFGYMYWVFDVEFVGRYSRKIRLSGRKLAQWYHFY